MDINKNYFLGEIMENKKGAMARVRQLRRGTGLMSIRRKELGITQMEMADYLDVQQTTYMRYENGYAKPRNPEVVEKIAKKLNMDIDELFKFLEIEKPKINYNRSFSEIPYLDNVVDNKIVIDSDYDYPTIKRASILSEGNYLAIHCPIDLGRVRKDDILFCSEPGEPLKVGDVLVVETEETITQQIVFETVEKLQKTYETIAVVETSKNHLICENGDGNTIKVAASENTKIYRVDYIEL